MSVTFTLNGKATTLDADPDMPLLWAIREVVGLHGTKYGCGIAQCGACTVHIEGQATRSCVTSLSAVAGQHVTTIEGITSKAAKAVQTAWIDLQVPQCGYCQSGQIMSERQLDGAARKNSDAQLAPIAARNARQPDTSLRLAVCLVWPRRAEKPRNIGLIRSLAVVHRMALLNSRTGKYPQINDKTASGAGHANH